jgi:glycosyltransferase involved in cell wall biosynthesis
MEVSVVIPTRNRIGMLRTALRSVLAQRDAELEVVVVDDGSSDGTVGELRGHGDRRVRLLEHPRPRGPNAARNTGARAASGSWVAFLDDDDVWAPDKLARQLAAARDSRRGWVYAGSVNVDARLRVIHGVPPPGPDAVTTSLPRFNAIPASASNVMIERSTFERLGGFDERLRACEEWDLWLRLLAQGQPACAAFPLVAYRMHRTNAILDIDAILRGARAIETRHATTVDRGVLHRWIAQLCLRDGRRVDAARHYALASISGAPGQAASDLTAIAWRTFHRAGLAPAPPRQGGDPAWEALADAWVADFRSSEPERSEAAP